MGKKTTFTDFDDLMSSPKDSAALSMDALKGNNDAEKVNKPQRATRGAAAGCKIGQTRHTYVMPEVMISKLKAISGYLGKSEVSVVLEMLEEGIEKYEKKFGPHISDITRGRK